MKTRAVRIHGAKDLRLEEFDLPPLRDDEILARVVSDTMCMSTHKLAIQGDRHKRVRPPLSFAPAIIGHEPCGEILTVGRAWQSHYEAGQKFVIQPALNYKGTPFAPGYSYPYMGGDATYVVVPREVMEADCLIVYEGPGFFLGSLAEPLSCIVSAFHSQYHTRDGYSLHEMGIRRGGSLALLASAGPMGLGAIDYAIHAEARPSRIVVTDVDEARLCRARSISTIEEAHRNGIELSYACTKNVEDPARYLRSLNRGELFDDVFVFTPVRSVVELGDQLLARDGCLNFFAGPNETEFQAALNFYKVHYEAHHYVGTSGGNTEDVREALALIATGRLNPVPMITHVGGLNAVPDAILELDRMPGGKRLIYTHKRLDLRALSTLDDHGNADPFLVELSRIVQNHNMLWSVAAEEFLLENAPEG